MALAFREILPVFILANCFVSAAWAEKSSDAQTLLELDMAELLKVQVTSVSKKAQALSDAPAAIFVINHDDIKHAGVTSVPEALRMAPGVNVSRINSSKWAVSIRGFNGRFANKLLVLIDGRTVYTSAFSGVYWDAQDVMLEDIERIEVIRGPGATLWGANAMNGVINIITKKAEDTQDGLLAAGGGNIETGFGALRYGKKLGDKTYARAYVKGFQRNEFEAVQGGNAGDDWHKQQGGFRVDSRLSNQDELTVQGDIYQLRANQELFKPQFTAPFSLLVEDQVKMSGWNITSRFQHTFSTTSQYSLKFYYDHYAHDDLLDIEKRNTFDLDFQHNFQLNAQQNIIWGLDYRFDDDQFSTTPILIRATERGTQLASAFVQHETMLIDDALWLTLGSKFEHNDYTGFEGQPTARLMWAASSKQRVWAAFSRAVRTPNRAETGDTILAGVLPLNLGNSIQPLTVTLESSKTFKSEVQFSYELGYRFTLAKQLSFDLAAFYNHYSRLRTFSLGDITTTGTLPNVATNLGTANTLGFEASAVWQMTDWWRWDASYSMLNSEIDKDSRDRNPVSPKHNISLRAELAPIDSVTLNFWMRYNSTAKSTNLIGNTLLPIKRYLTMDAQLGWKIHPKVELALIGQNLLDNNHLEFIEEISILPTEIPRSVYGKITFAF